MAKKESLIPLGRIEHLIQLIRNHRVILDADLARLYGVATKALNQAVKRNRKRFPPDFMFRLTEEEKNEVVTACDHLSRLRFSPVLPCAFTEHGAIMLANVLNSERAVKASVQVVRAFVRLREVLASNRELVHKFGRAGTAYRLARRANPGHFRGHPPASQSARTTPEEDRLSRARRPRHARSRAPGRSPVTPEQRAEITCMSQSGEDLSPEWARTHSARRFTSG